MPQPPGRSRTARYLVWPGTIDPDRMPNVLPIALLTCLLAGTCVAQDLAWKLPEGCAVIYRRTYDCTGEEVEPGKPARRVLLPEWNYTPPLFFAGELDDRQQYLTQPIFFLNEIALHLAVDLRHTRKAGKRVIEMPLTAYFRPYRIHVEYAPISASGSQRIVATVKGSREPFGEGGGWGRSLDLEMKIRRKVDRERGVVESFDVDGHWQLRDAPDKGKRHAKIHLRESYTLARTELRSDAAFEASVRKAIEKGTHYLYEQMRKPLAERYSSLGPKPSNTKEEDWHGPGYRALTVLTLIKVGVPKEDPVLQAALEDLRRLNITESYALACAIMAMEAYYAPEGEREALRTRKLRKPTKRKLSRRDRKVVQEWTDRLLHNHDTNVDKSYRLRFRYHHASGYDNSVSQYAMLGLYSANLCGVKISPQVWFAAADHWLDQATVTDKKPMRVQVSGPGSRLVPARNRTVAQLPLAPPCRWDYYKDYLPSASMTAAGVTGVTVCLAALRDLKRGPRKLRRALEERQRGGLGWLSRNYSMRAVGGAGRFYNRHRDYYWFGFERAMELNQIELLHGRDWYFEGAQIILGRQDRGGG